METPRRKKLKINFYSIRNELVYKYYGYKKNIFMLYTNKRKF